MARLWIDQGIEEKRRELEQLLRSIAPGADSNQWAVFPHLALNLGHFERQTDISIRIREGRAIASAFSSTAGPTLIRVGPYLLVSTSTQNQRVLQPIWELLAEEIEEAPKRFPLPRLSGKSFASVWRRANCSLDAIKQSFSDAALTAPADVALEVLKACVVDERIRRAYESLPDPPSAVVAATQHNAVTRAVLGALPKDVHTFYVPHAPLATNIAYEDLPFTHALLRGDGERSVYGDLGADSSRMFVVGDPTPASPHRSLSTGDTLLFAFTIDTPEHMRALVEVVAGARIEPVEVVLHPRSNRNAYRRLFPSSWTISDARTTRERLQVGGVAAVVQVSSGAGLDSLQMNVPLIELKPEGRAVNYRYLQSDLIPKVSSSDELRAAFGKLTEDFIDNRNLYEDLARKWCERTGESAARAAAQILLRTNRSSPELPLFDRWRS